MDLWLMGKLTHDYYRQSKEEPEVSSDVENICASSPPLSLE